MADCLICGSPAQIDNSNIHMLKITCTQCAKFAITDIVLNSIPKNRYPNWAQILQEYIRMNQTADYVLIDKRRIDIIFGF